MELCGKDFSFSAGAVCSGLRCDVLVSGIVTENELSMCQGLSAVVVPYAGIPDRTSQVLSRHPGIQLHSIHHNAVSTAEMAVTLMLAASKQIIPADRSMRKGDWTPRYSPQGLIIEDSRILVLGYGAIGSRVGTICRAMGASVKGVRSRKDHGFHTAADLTVLLPETDILIVCLPLNDSTRGIIGKKELDLLPRGAVLVNIARGPVVDEEALFESLSSGHLGAAGIDVWYNYPDSEESRESTPPSRFDFGSINNVVMSPHRGGSFGLPGIERRRIEHLAAIIQKLYFSIIKDNSCRNEY